MWRARKRHSTASSITHARSASTPQDASSRPLDSSASSLLPTVPPEAATTAPFDKSATNRRKQRRWKRKQYHMVADEIERVLYDDNDDDDDWGTNGETTDASTRPFAFSASSRTRRLSLPTLRRLSLSSSLAATTTTATATTAPVRLETPSATETNSSSRSSSSRSRRRSGGDVINTYSLFDTAGAPENQRLVSRRRTTASSTVGSNNSATATSPNASDTSTPAVIYGKSYYTSPSSFFAPIILFLSMTFAILIVIRLLVSLLTMAVGILIWMVVCVHVVQQYSRKPLWVVRNIHASPVKMMALAGAWMGMGHGLWKHVLQEYLQGTLSMVAESLLGQASLASSSSSLSNNNRDSIQQDILLLWGIVEGLIYGLEMGALWLIVFGDASDPSAISKWMYRRLWRPLQGHYRQSLRRHRVRQRLDRLPAVLVKGSSRMTTALCPNDREDDLSQQDRRQCMICLEPFFPEPASETSTEDYDDDNTTNNQFRLCVSKKKPIQSRTYLPCLHGFHTECLEQWLSVKSTCPICRIPILDTTT